MSERNKDKVNSFVAFTKEAKISNSEKEMIRIYRKTKEVKEAIAKHSGEYNQLPLHKTQGMTQGSRSDSKSTGLRMLTSTNSEESHRHLEMEQIKNNIGVMTQDISEMKKYYKAMNSQLKTVNRNFRIFSESQQGQRIHMPNGLNINQYIPPINKINKNIVFFQRRSFWETILRKM
jgi:subtilase family serine protease